MRIAVIGAGYVGLVTGVCLAELGHEVTCADTNTDRVALLEHGVPPFHEPDLAPLVEKNLEARRLHFTSDVEAASAGRDAVLLAVGTPSRPEDGRADLSAVRAAAQTVARNADDGTVLVTKSTVPVGTGRELASVVGHEAPDRRIPVASNPEFLREGTAVREFMEPDRIIAGTDDTEARDVLRSLYAPLTRCGIPLIETGIESAELAKYAANAYLATRLSFINEIADLCERVGADVDEVAEGMGSDHRIGRAFLRAGPGYGGSCFPKDTAALSAAAADAGSRLRIVEAAAAVNRERRHASADRVADALGGHLDGSLLAVLGVTFKAGTDDVRNSPALDLISELQRRGARVRVHDPKGAANAAETIDGVTWSRTPLEAAEDADAVVLATDWPEYLALDPGELRARLARPIVVDLRNALDATTFRNAGLARHGIGKQPEIPGD